MDAAVIALVVAIIIMILFHPGTQMFIEHLKSKSTKNKQESKKCYHTVDDCIDCMASDTCPLKKENVVFVRKHDEYTN